MGTPMIQRTPTALLGAADAVLALLPPVRPVWQARFAIFVEVLRREIEIRDEHETFVAWIGVDAG